MTRRELLELRRLCLRALRYGLAAAGALFVGILALGYFLSRWP